MYKRTAYLIFLFLAAAASFSCRKETPKGKLEQGQVAMTFDDASIENWHQYLPLLDSLHIKATFYISSYHTFNAQKKAWLKEIENHGHEIAFHTASHPDMPKEVAKKGMAKVEETEITKDLNLMKNDGYTITNFAYPFGSHSTQLNTCLLRTFKSVRALSNQQNYKKSLVKESGDWKVLYGADIDNNSKLNEHSIENLLDAAQQYNDCLVLVGHQINNSTIKLQVSRERLIMLSKAAAERNLRFITVNQIAR